MKTATYVSNRERVFVTDTYNEYEEGNFYVVVLQDGTTNEVNENDLIDHSEELTPDFQIEMPSPRGGANNYRKDFYKFKNGYMEHDPESDDFIFSTMSREELEEYYSEVD